MQRYLELGHVIFEWGAGRLVTADEAVAVEHGFVRRREITSPNFTMVPQLLVGTQRVATLQTRLAEVLSANLPLKILSCPMPIPTLVEVMQWHKYQDRDPAIMWFSDLLRRVAGDMGGPGPQ